MMTKESAIARIKEIDAEILKYENSDLFQEVKVKEEIKALKLEKHWLLKIK